MERIIKWRHVLLFLLIVHANTISCAENTIQADLVIIGSSAVGQGAIEAIIRKINNMKVVWISKEHSKPYNKVYLKDYLVDAKTSDLKILSVNSKISTKFGYEVTSLDTKANVVEIEGPKGREKIQFKKLLIGVGLKNKILEIEGSTPSQFNNVFSYYSLADTTNIMNYINRNNVKVAAVIGTGINALECASSLHKRGIHVHIIGRGSNILSKLLEPKESILLKKLIIDKGKDTVNFYIVSTKLEVSTKAVSEKDLKSVSAIILPNEGELKVDMIAYAIGTLPNTEFLKDSGINLDKAGFIITNRYLQTNFPDIYAAGDAALVYNIVWNKNKPSVKWQDAHDQGNCAAENMMQPTYCQYKGIAPVMVSKPFGNRFGAAEKEDEVSLVEKIIDRYPVYVRTSVDNHNILKSFVLINGDMSELYKLRNAYMHTKPFDSNSLFETNEYSERFRNFKYKNFKRE